MPFRFCRTAARKAICPARGSNRLEGQGGNDVYIIVENAVGKTDTIVELAGAGVDSVVAEFVAGTGGTGAGLAYQILQAGFQLNIPRLFAALMLITVKDP